MTSPQIPPDILPRARKIIQPMVGTEDERDALLTEAFYVYDPLLYSIERGGAPKVFAVLCIRKLLDYGCLPNGEHALARLLTTARYDCGVDKHPEIDALNGILNALCNESKVTPKPEVASAMPITSALQTIATPRNERTPTVFISYSHTDTDFAQQLIRDLNAAGHACWIDTSEIKGGDEWIMTIADGIINSYAFVPIVTLKALQSRWVQDEILWAKNKKKLIIPVILENVLDETRFFPLVSYQGVTLFDSDYATALSRLLSYLPAPRLPDVEISPDEVDEIDNETPKPVTISQPRTVPRKLELAYLERLQLEELLNTEKYTAMGGTSEVRRKAEMRAVFELLPMGREREQQPRETRRFENAVDEIQVIRRCVLLGEPGGGKTTTIWKLAADLVERALTDRTAPIPLLVRLGKWTDADQSLPDFIASQLGDLGAYLEPLLSEKRAALLLDGLNEIPASQHKAKYQKVRQFVEANTDLLVVVSCRELDYTIDLGFDKINITPLDPIRIREFVRRYLGEAKGDDLFWKLAGERAADWHRRFMDEIGNKLEQPERVFWTAAQLPEGITWDYWHNNDNTYWHKWLNEREKPSGLMVLARNPYMLLMLTSVYAVEGKLPDNRGQLFAKFVETLLEREGVPDDEHTPLTDGLAKVAYEMQIRRAEADSDGSNALTVLPRAEVESILGERLLYLARSASILSVGDQVRFTHQLLQEYFAAKYMDIEIRAGRLQASDIWKPESWWERTNWEEAAILLAGLYSDDPTPVVLWLMDAQPEIAAQCITRSGVTPPPDQTLLKLRAVWIPRLTDLEGDPDPRARAAVGRALGQLVLSSGEPLDNRRGVSVIVRDGVRLPDIDWVTIPAGVFIYGDDNKDDYPHLARPADRQQITLPAFQISRYPVTYAQFQCFVEAADYNDDRWWEGIPGEEEVFGTVYKTRELSQQRFPFWNHPREMVTWYQAVAFCRWLSDKVGYEITLPTEQQWERAARGTDGRKYPYEGEFDAAKGNTEETGIGQTSAVGIFPNGASLDGVLDMSGNVWEWCANKSKEPDMTDVDDSGALRVLRGGSWNTYPYDARAAFRNNLIPNSRISFSGFRLCCVRAPSL
ncbi:MAG: TIR domain-containing protein [Chloroflexi bacterium]|nr:MAG: TIR domain-containing protein [Chloroflexota bacterium]